MLAVIRLSGRRTLGEMTAFDPVLLLIIAETTQQAPLGEDFSIAKSPILVATLVGLDIRMSVLKQRFDALDRVIDGRPMIIVQNGHPIEDRLRKARPDKGDIMAAARKLHAPTPRSRSAPFPPQPTRTGCVQRIIAGRGGSSSRDGRLTGTSRRERNGCAGAVFTS